MKKNRCYLKIVLFILLVGVLIFKVIYFRNLEKESITSQKVLLVENNTLEKKTSYKEEIKALRKKNNNNKDIIGILEIENSDFVVPLVQSKDNDYYLNHLPNKKRNFYGSIFLDYRVNVDDSKKLLIYGHNSSKYKMPFDILENYYDEDYLNEHRYINIKTENKVRRYQLFSIYIEPKDFSYMKVKYKNNEYLKHINKLKKNSMYNLDVEVNENDNILILQTCSTHKKYRKYEKKFLLLSFKEIDIIE